MSELLSDRIHRLRKARGLKLKQVAGQLGVSISAVSQWECGERRLYAGHVPPLAAMLGVTIAALLVGADEEAR